MERRCFSRNAAELSVVRTFGPGCPEKSVLPLRIIPRQTLPHARNRKSVSIKQRSQRESREPSEGNHLPLGRGSLDTRQHTGPTANVSLPPAPAAKTGTVGHTIVRHVRLEDESAVRTAEFESVAGDNRVARSAVELTHSARLSSPRRRRSRSRPSCRPRSSEGR